MKEVISKISAESEDPAGDLTLFLANEGLRFLDVLELNPMTSKQSALVRKHLSDKAESL
jgi:hypothetical protein